MTKGLIDSASVHGVLAALSSKKIDKCSPWTLQSITEVTSALINDPLFEVSPGPGSYSGDYGLAVHMMKCIAPIVSHSTTPPKIVRKATNRVKTWTHSNHEAIRKIYEKLRTDKSYQSWIDNSIENFFVEHTATLNGLFDETFIPELAHILNCKERELFEVWQLTRNLNVVKDWARNRPENDEFRLAVDAYVIAAVLRGRLHDHIAEASHIQILHHPLRYPILPPKTKYLEFKVTDAEMFFNSIIVMGSFQEKSVKDRIACYADNVVKAKRAMGEIDLSERGSASLARDAAIRAAKKIGLQTLSGGLSRRLSIELDKLFWLLSESLAYFALFQWTRVQPEVVPLTGHVLNGATKIITGISVGDKIVSTYAFRRGRLSKLADAVPGRVTGNWVQRG
jgi:hypothetical protein